MFAAAKALLTHQQGAASTFVTRNSTTGNLMLNGSRFRFAGANVANDIGLPSTSNGNAYGGTAVSGFYLTPHSQINAVMDSAQSMKATVLRVLCAIAENYGTANAFMPTFGPTFSNYQSSGLDPLDYALYQCSLRGLKLIVPFVDMNTSVPNWFVSNTGGGANSNFWTRPATINAYKDMITQILSHVNPYTGVALKNDPGVLCWETGNELVSGVSNAQLTTWSSDIGSHIKATCGGQQLVMAGQYGITDDTSYLAVQEIDLYSDHTYDNTRTPSHLSDESDVAHSHGKAFVVGEYTWTDKNSGGTTLAWSLGDLLPTLENHANLDGSCFWDLLAPLTSWGDSFTLHYPGDNTDMQTRGDFIADHALRMKGITPGTFVSDSCTGTNGTALSSHVGEAGATWDFNDAWTGVASIQSNRLWASTEAHYYASGVPAAADYTVSGDVYTASLRSGSYVGPVARSETKINYSYAAYIWSDGTTASLYLDYFRAGASKINLGSASVTAPAVGSIHTVKLKVQGNQLSVYWDNVLKIGPVTHSSLILAGRAGAILGGSTSALGFHLDNITGTDL